jgi:hypothetical protein
LQLFVMGGRQRPPRLLGRAEWHDFDEARLVRLDTKTGAVELGTRYRTPAGLCPADDPAILFKAGSWDGDRLLLCTQTEILSLDPATMRVVDHYSHRWFNDVHHVARIDGRLHVVSTGLDALLVVDPERDEVVVRSALEESPWERFDPATDWRLVPTTKPHRAHPNFVFRTRHGVWLTRFAQKDAICLDDQGRSIQIGIAQPHDGHVWNGQVWFTTVNGHVVAADPETGAIVVDRDLQDLEEDSEPVGWCRGLYLQDGVAYVGFSRLRSTRWKENLSWLRPGARRWGQRPTRVVAYDLQAGRKLAEWDLELVLNSVFSILPAAG